YYIAYLIISSVQLGATVDYAILMTDRYKENRHTLEKKEAVVQTISDVTVSILTSGSVLTVVGLLLGFISTNQLLAQLGIFIGRGAIFSLTIVLLVLPGLLLLFDKWVIHTRKVKLMQEETK
ncbi:MAG: MMPL family transporter, partial [Dorea sp.]